MKYREITQVYEVYHVIYISSHDGFGCAAGLERLPRHHIPGAAAEVSASEDHGPIEVGPWHKGKAEMLQDMWWFT